MTSQDCWFLAQNSELFIYQFDGNLFKLFPEVFKMNKQSINQHLLSHTLSSENIETSLQKITTRIIQQGNKPDVTVNRQLELLDQLKQFDLGRFLIQNQGLNGYWTHYILTYPWRKRDGDNKSYTDLELFILERAPVFLATQQRFEIFLQENQKSVKDNAKLACIPCGLMGELLYLNLKNKNNLQLIGIDYDASVLNDISNLANKLGFSNLIKFIQSDAWELQIQNQFDLISSNGLNIYEPNDDRVEELYRKFYLALKPDGKLVTSFLTLPPNTTDHSEWNMEEINQDDLKLQKVIFVDILEAKWQCFRSSQKTKMQLESVGFRNIRFIYDRARLFPTVIAEK